MADAMDGDPHYVGLRDDEHLAVLYAEISGLNDRADEPWEQRFGLSGSRPILINDSLPLDVDASLLEQGLFVDSVLTPEQDDGSGPAQAHGSINVGAGVEVNQVVPDDRVASVMVDELRMLRRIAADVVDEMEILERLAAS